MDNNHVLAFLLGWVSASFVAYLISKRDQKFAIKELRSLKKGVLKELRDSFDRGANFGRSIQELENEQHKGVLQKNHKDQG